jgi:ribosomal protein S14
MKKLPKEISRVLEENNHLCRECGSDELVIATQGTTLCRLCFAEKAGLKLKFESPTIDIVKELEKQGKGTKFVKNFLGISAMQILRIKRG